jgi:hypothetical protein
MSLYGEIYETISDHQAEIADDPEQLRLMKLSEEVGEVMQAYIGVVGANKRKGVTHYPLDVAKELCDVIVTARVALQDWVDDPERFLELHVQGVASRVRKDGS